MWEPKNKMAGHRPHANLSGEPISADEYCHWVWSQSTSFAHPWTWNFSKTLVSFGRGNSYLTVAGQIPSQYAQPSIPQSLKPPNS